MKKLFMCVFATFALWLAPILFFGGFVAFVMNTPFKNGVQEIVDGSLAILWMLWLIPCVVIAFFVIYQPKDDPNFQPRNDLDEVMFDRFK